MAESSTSSFDPSRSRVGDDAMAGWIQAEISGDLAQVPGIGPATEQKLKENGISTTWQLLGKYLSLRDTDVGTVELADRFYFWLCSLDTSAGHRAGIVLAVAEKLNLAFPGIYNAAAYETEA